VFFTTADLLNLDVDVIFYDTTSASFSIDEEDDDAGEDDTDSEGALREYGRSKRRVSPQVVSRCSDADGLPVRSWVFPGNTTDTTTVAKVKEDLQGWKLGARFSWAKAA